MSTIIRIEAKSDQLVENVLKSRTICGIFNTGDNISHAFQLSLTGEDLTKSITEQKLLFKKRLKEFIISFKQTKSTNNSINNDWNQEYQENI